METVEPQAQRSVIANGATEASTGSAPASPPPALASALSDRSRSAEQVKDGSTPPTTLAIGTSAPTKKFTTVNINKRFMEKNSPTPGASQIPSSSASSKIAGTAVKSPTPPAISHSRLVTTKLTKLLSAPTGTGPGWTRPPSTTPSMAPSPVSGAVSSAPLPAPAPVPHGPPQLPYAGRVIQPQPRGAMPIPSTSKSESTNGSGKPAWRNVRQGGTSSGVGPSPGVQNEFPTAAEVAQDRLNGIQEKRQPTCAPVAPSPTTTEADTFRGVHLNPNAHHWDEMEEDNDDYLDGVVIEFGDGRQYSIQPVDVPHPTQDAAPSPVPVPETSSPDPQSPSATARTNKEDRFSDDFDRSWPRSAALSSNIRPRVGPPAGASASSSSSLSPQEASRVLFNERSNRLEPWSSNNRVGPPDGRSGRDAPLHHNVQLLQKQGFDRSREVRRDTSSSQGTEDRHWERGRRASNATTTHSALSGRDSSRESLRQFPPHPVSVPNSLPPLHTHQPLHTHPPSSRQGSTREQWRQGHSPERSLMLPPSPVDLDSQVASPSTPSVAALSPQAPTAASTDLELARKAAMHSAAERARVRRQQEEEEREKERERARKKAADLEEKMKLCEVDKAKEPAATQETQPEPATSQISTGSSPDRSPLFRPASSRGPTSGPTVPMTRTRSQRGSQSANQPPATSSAVTSWRSSAAPLPPIAPRRLSLSHSPVTPPVQFPSASQVLDTHLFNPGNDESLEEVEFTDLGKFVGVEPEPEETVVQGDAPEIPNDDRPAPPRSRGDLEPSWRRKAPLAPVEEQPTVVLNAAPDATTESPPSREADTVPTSPSVRTTSTGLGSPAKPLAEGALPGLALVVPSLSSQRSPRTPSYREELRSTFDDTMSRIKGAMQAKPQWNAPGTEHHTDRAATNSAIHFAEQPRFGRGIALAPQLHPTRILGPEESFTTMTELDHEVQRGQPFHVRLPSVSPAREPLSRRELANLKRAVPPLRLEVLSWDPPVEGMLPRDYSVNGILFRKPPLFKGRPRFFVKLPAPGSFLFKRVSPASPKVHLPAKSLVNKTVAATGAFGRPRVADDYSNWRRTLPSIPDQVESTANSDGLVTRSGSSPPDTDKASDATPSVQTETPLPVQWPTRPRTGPKMPAGAGVAFYRGSKSSPSVNFTVSSELEDVRQSDASETPLVVEEPAPTSQALDVSKGNEASSPSLLPASRTKTESKSSDGSSDTPLTPPNSTGWTKSLVKESPVRKPDPEHLKLLWSQTSEKANVPGVNSLEGITDDLPSVPFTLQEVKSEDGETPPPIASNGSGPSRMSLHEVTRAFQQVPPPPAGSITRKASPQSPAVQSSTSGPTRHPAFPPHAQPVHSTVGGPGYPQYPSPMLSHSPAPTMMYPHAIAPNHMMGGPSAQFPMWIPMPAPPGGQTPGGVARPLPSPYPAHPSYIPYPSPSAYAASQPGPPNGAQSRSRPAAPTGMSPSLSHSRVPAPVPMYQGSPVLVHPQVMHVQPSYPGAMPAGRGVPMQAPHPTPAPHAGRYTPATHASYVRPPW